MEIKVNTTNTVKQPKEFEEEIKFNPEFLGLFREELIKCELKDENNTLYNDISSIKSDDENEIKQENNISVLHINSKQEVKENKEVKLQESNDKKEEKANCVITLDTNDYSGEIKDFSKIKKLLTEHNSVTTSSTLISHDDMKNLNLDEYEIYKIKEIIKYFANIKK